MGVDIHSRLKRILWVGGSLLCLFFACKTSAPINELAAHTLRNIYPIRLENQLLLSSECEGQPCLVAVDCHTREVQWSWLDEHNEIESAYHGLQAYLTDSLWVLPFRQSIKVFQWPEGKLLYDIHFEQGQLEPYLRGVGHQVFFVLYQTPADGGHYGAIAELNLHTGQHQELVRRPIAPGQVLKMMPAWQASESDSCLVYSTLSYTREAGGVSYLHRYCQHVGTQDSLLVYPANAPGYGIARPFLPEATTPYTYWQTTDGLLKLDGAAFKIKWQFQLHASILTSEVFNLGEQLVYPSESLKFYAVDKSSGQVTDTLLNTPGTPGRLFKRQQLVYFAGGTDGLLYSWDPSDPTSLKPHSQPQPSIQRIMYADDELLILLHGNSWHFYSL